MSTKRTPPRTFGEFVELTGGTRIWAQASGRSEGRISQMKKDGGGVGIADLMALATKRTGVPHDPAWSRPAHRIVPAVTVWPWSPDTAETGRLAS